MHPSKDNDRLKRIIFVDDDRQLLNGLRHALRKQRHRWELSFAEGGQAALERLAAQPCDVIVSDMRMPGMDGAALLEQVKRVSPASFRIILSGYAEREAHVKALSVAHQFLDKPCDAEMLVAVLERALELQRLLGDESLRRLSWAAPDTLPAASWALAAARLDPGRLEDALNDLETEHRELLGDVCRLGGLPPRGSWHEAHAQLGLDRLRGLFILAHALAPLEPSSVPPAYTAYSLVAAAVAQRAAPPARAYEAYVAGLLHDYGLLLLPASLADVPAREVPAFTHGEMGASVLLRWGMSSVVAEAVARHDAPGAISGADAGVLGAVHVAGSLARSALPGPLAFGHPLDEAWVRRAGLAPHLDGWRALAEEEARRGVVP